MEKLPEANRPLTRIQLGSLIGIASLALILNLWGNQFPLGYHFDEPKKVQFILSWQQDFHHPVLMLELARAVNLVLQLEDEFAVVVMGRCLMALVGTALVLLVFLVACKEMGAGRGLLAAALTAVMPTLVLHSHYLKEDMLLTLFCLMTLGVFADYLKKPHVLRAAMVGLPLGLAFASHYKSLLLLPTLAVFTLVSCRGRCLKPGLMIGVSLVTGLFVFMMVNIVILDDPEIFRKGFHHERSHALNGHTVPIYWYHFGMGYHLIYSVIPGMTLPVAVCSVLSFVWYVTCYKKLTNLEKVLIIFGLISYVVPEISPTKPPPDDCRYVLPLIPVLTYFFAKAIGDLWGWIQNGFSRGIMVACIVLMFAIALVDSAMLDYYLTRDTRDQAADYVRQHGFKAEFEPMAGPGIDGPWGFLADVESLRRDGYSHYLISSFGYQQFRLGEKLDGQPANVSEFHHRYQRLLEYPGIEFRPGHRQFGFSNPTVHVLDIRARPKTD